MRKSLVARQPNNPRVKRGGFAQNPLARLLRFWDATIILIVVVFMSMSVCLAAVTNTWTGSTDTDWFSAGNWSESAVPSNGWHVVITNAGQGILLTNSTAELASFNIMSNTLTFTNWTTTLNASNVTIQSGATLTLPGDFTNNVMSNRVYIVCTNFTLGTNGSINADAKGYAGRTASSGLGYGPGGGENAAGGGYGGKGGDHNNFKGGSPYGSTNAPLNPGSGGGGGGGVWGGAGGGAVRIEASGDVTVNGSITANGGANSSGGSGGGIFITCEGVFSGSTNGVIQANGGDATYGAGGGGRIAVICTNMVRENVKVRFSTAAGTGGAYGGNQPEMGTLYLPDTKLLSETLDRFDNVWIIIPNFTVWSVASLTLSNRVVSLGSLGDSDFCLTVTNDLVIVSGGLSLGGVPIAISTYYGVGENTTGLASNMVVNVGGNVTLTNGGALTIHSGVTNGTQDYGALVTVTGTVSVGSASWIYPYSHPTNGGSILFRVGSLVISTNGGINADAKGYAGRTTGGNGPGCGPGGGEYAAGGGYGGKGGDHTNLKGGNPYGSTNAPLDPGSGGGGGAGVPGGAGGGAVRIEASGDVTVNGAITANGGSDASGGSGGGIFITCEGVFSGSTNGVIQANGGDATYGAGGGGRIAVWYAVPNDRWEGIRTGTDMQRVSITTNVADAGFGFSGAASVTNGIGGSNDGEMGTKIFLTVTPPSGTTFMCM